MSDAATSAKPSPKMGYCQAMVRGRIEETRRHGNNTYTRILTPAADEFSRPQSLEIRSRARLGQKGDVVTCLVQLGGYTRKAFRATDKDTGETSMVTPVDHTLDAIEE